MILDKENGPKNFGKAEKIIIADPLQRLQCIGLRLALEDRLDQEPSKIKPLSYSSKSLR